MAEAEDAAVFRLRLWFYGTRIALIAILMVGAVYFPPVAYDLMASIGPGASDASLVETSVMVLWLFGATVTAVATLVQKPSEVSKVHG